MTKIVFACKSNSCRSQMAEGWAKDWLVRKFQDIDRQEEELLRPENESKCDIIAADIQKRRTALENIVVASVALDSSAVFSDCRTCCGDVCETDAQRKAVKTKAVEAMASEGVDISSAAPKTLAELMPELTTKYEKEAGKMRDCNMNEISESFSPAAFVSEEEYPQPEETPDVLGTHTKLVDRLVILCSCGDDVKRQLVGSSKSVEEWEIDPPTTAAKIEGDPAYRRVCLEIREEVNVLMNKIVSVGALA